MTRIAALLSISFMLVVLIVSAGPAVLTRLDAWAARPVPPPGLTQAQCQASVLAERMDTTWIELQCVRGSR